MPARKVLCSVALCAIAIVLALGTLGCGFKATVTVQLVNSATSAPYPVDQMTVYLEMEGGSTVSGVTGSTGSVTFTVTEPGTYRVVRVDGSDVTGGAIGDEGREFVKDSPLITVEPLTSYAFSGTLPAVTVDNAMHSYAINAEIPRVRRVTIIHSQNVDVPETPQTNIEHDGGFAGRVVLRNINFDRGGMITLYPSNTTNRLILYPGPTSMTSTMYASGGSTPVVSLNPLTSPYTAIFEAPGDGDWVLNAAGTVITRQSLGGVGAARDFNGFVSGIYLNIYNGGIAPSDPISHFRFELETQAFESF